MTDSLDAVNTSVELLIADLADEFRDRLARGEAPDPNDLADRHPEIAGLVRGVLSALCLAPTPASSVARLPGPDLVTGTLGDFRIVREIGRGGMGVVYEARQISLNRRVALKVLPFAALADSRMLQRFRNEAQAAAALDHPHVVKVHWVGEDRGVHYLAMQFIDGRPLSDLIRERQGHLPLPAPGRGPGGGVGEDTTNALSELPLPGSGRGPGGGGNADTAPVARASTVHTRGDVAYFRQIAEWGAQAADALEHAHSMGVVHRDVKPGNLLLDKNGQIWVADFGLAKLAASDANVTMTGDIFGTLRYMSPEQALAKHDLVDHRTDIYSLGATLYELISGRPAAAGREKVEILRNILDRDPRAVRTINRSVPADLEKVIHKCLRKEAVDRYATSKDLADDLRRFVRGEAVIARPVGAIGRLTRWRRRNPSLAAATALAACALLAVSAVSARWAMRERDNAREVNTALEKAEYRLAENYVDQGVALCEKGDVRAGLLWLTRAMEKAPASAEDFRELVRMQIARWGADLRPLVACMDFPGPVTAAAMSPDGRTVWAAGEDKSIHRWDVQSGVLLPSLSPPDRVSKLLWSPDGTVVLSVCRDGTAQRWDAATGQQLGSPQTHTVSSAAWATDGRFFVTGSKDGAVHQWNGRTSEAYGPEFKHIGDTPAITAIAVSPDQRTILTANAVEIRFWDSTTGRLLGDRLSVAKATVLAFNPDGTFLTISDDRNTQLWDSSTHLSRGKPVRHRGMIETATFDPSGTSFVTGGNDRAARTWSTSTEEPAAAPITHQSAVMSVAFSADGRTLLTAAKDGAVRLWGTAPGRERELVLRHSSDVRWVAYSPDGTKVLTASYDKTARLWNSATGEALGKPLDHPSHVMRVAFRPDGKAAMTLCYDKITRLWDTDTCMEIAQFPNLMSAVNTGIFSPDGSTILLAFYDGTVRFWHPETGTVQNSPLVHRGAVLAAAFSPDRPWAVTGGVDGFIQFWNPVTGQPDGPRFRHGGGVGDVVFSPDGQILLSGGGDHRVRGWECGTGARFGPDLVHGSKIWAATFSPDGQTALTGSEDGTARLWDVATGRPRGHPLMHQDQVRSAKFNPDGRMALTASFDGTARLWDAATGKQLGPPMVHGTRIWLALFSPNGRQILTGGNDNTARLWSLPLPVAGTVEELALRAELTTGLSIDKNDVLSALGAANWHDRRKRLMEIGVLPPQE